MRSLALSQTQDLSDDRALVVNRKLLSFGAAAETIASALIRSGRTVKQ